METVSSKGSFTIRIEELNLCGDFLWRKLNILQAKNKLNLIIVLS